MAMHHMYAMKSHVDLDGSMNVTGYWSTPQNASERIDAGFVVDYLIESQRRFHRKRRPLGLD